MTLGPREWRGLALLFALFTAPAWLPQIGLQPPTMSGTAAEAQIRGWQDPLATDHIARDIFQRVNVERQARGAPQLRWDEDLAALAREWSVHMLAEGDYGHSPDEFRVHPAFVGTGENILMGHRGAREAHVGWMRSEGHRANILNVAYGAVGIGVVCRGDGSMWATQIFGVSTSAPRPPPPVDTQEEPIVADGRGPLCPATGGPFS